MENLVPFNFRVGESHERMSVKICEGKPQTCKEALEDSGLSSSLLFKLANSGWRSRPAQPKSRPTPISYDDTPDLADIDPKLLACFGTCNSEASLASTAVLYYDGDCHDTVQAPQCMSGFLSEHRFPASPASEVSLCSDKSGIQRDHPLDVHLELGHSQQVSALSEQTLWRAATGCTAL